MIIYAKSLLSRKIIIPLGLLVFLSLISGCGLWEEGCELGGDVTIMVYNKSDYSLDFKAEGHPRQNGIVKNGHWEFDGYKSGWCSVWAYCPNEAVPCASVEIYIEKGSEGEDINMDGNCKCE